MDTANVAAPLVFGIIIVVAVAAFWVAPRRRNRLRRDEENQYIAPRPNYTRPVSTYKPSSNEDMDLPPYPAPAHMGPDDPVPSYEEATGQTGRSAATQPAGSITNGAHRP